MNTPFSLEKLDSICLHETALEASRTEKAATLHLLEIPHWIDKRRVFNDRGYSSLFDYVHQGLGYSESQTSERIRAMRLAFAVPEVHESLANGRLTLTSAARVASHARKEELRPEQVAELLPRVEFRSVQQVDRVLAALAPETPKIREHFRALDAERTELKLILGKEALRLLEEARALDADPGIATLEIFKRSLRKYVAEKKARKTGALRSPKLRLTAVTESSDEKLRTRYVPSFVKRAVWQRAESSCEFIDPKTRKRCSATRALTLEHLTPFALGGSHALENLALYCSSHNAHAAEKIFGRWRKRGSD